MLRSGRPQSPPSSGARPLQQRPGRRRVLMAQRRRPAQRRCRAAQVDIALKALAVHGRRSPRRSTRQAARQDRRRQRLEGHAVRGREGRGLAVLKACEMDKRARCQHSTRRTAPWQRPSDQAARPCRRRQGQGRARRGARPSRRRRQGRGRYRRGGTVLALGVDAAANDS
jgi:hypothetical protein